MSNLEKYLKELGACREARKWAASYSTLQEAWDACENGAWMLWLAARRAGGEAWSDKRKPVLAAALDCAETVKDLWPAKSAAQIAGAVGVLRQWIAGQASIEQAKEAREKLRAAYADAAYAAVAAAADADAAYAAAYAAYAAAYAAYAVDAAYATRLQKLKECAVIMRAHFPVMKMEGV